MQPQLQVLFNPAIAASYQAYLALSVQFHAGLATPSYLTAWKLNYQGC